MATESPDGRLQEKEFEDSPRGWAQRLRVEYDAAKKSLEKWRKQGEDIDKRYRDERDSSKYGDTRWNLFTSGVETKLATLYGKTPRVTVSRRFGDPGDDVARVAGEMLERLLNTDIERDEDTYALAMEYALQDRLLPGVAFARVRYEMGETEMVPGKEAVRATGGTELAPAVPETERRPNEQAETDYVHWRDVLWNQSRTWHEVRLLFFRAEMSREQLVKRFGKLGQQVPLNAGRKQKDSNKADPWARAEVWEVWDKTHRRVYWWVDGYPQVLDAKDDPLGLDGFWPVARPMLAGCTTSKLIPRPDYVVAQDLYDEIDLVSTRITLLERAVRVAGVYDKTSGEVRRLLTEVAQNELIPVDRWAAFAEKGGIKGAIDWLPLEQVVGAMNALRDYRTELKDALYEITGMADIMRGQASAAGTSATEQAIKAKFGSVRMQRLQDEFARFASDVQRLKAEIIAKHFDERTIIGRSNVLATPDAAMAEQAVRLIKSGLSHYRIEVKPEAVSLTDFAQLKQDRTEVIGAVSQFMSAAAPLAQQSPASLPFLLEMLQWLVSGLRGASQIEGVLDRAIHAAKQAAQQPRQPQQDPKEMAKLEGIRLKAQADMAKADKELQNDIVRAQVDAQSEEAKQRAQMEWNLREQVARDRLKLTQGPQVAPGAPPHRGGGS